MLIAALLLSVPPLPLCVPATAQSCAPGCPLSSLSNGVCNPECNVPDCLFDGGDCACVDPKLGPGICPCGGGMLRRDDGCEWRRMR